MAWFGNKTKVQSTTVENEVKKSPIMSPSIPAPIDDNKASANKWESAENTTGGLIIEEDKSTVSETATMFFSNGQYDQAQSVLTQHLNETRGDTEKNIWYLLLDLYQIQKNKKQFEKLAELFAKKFNVSPPSWGLMNINQETQFSGRNVIVLDGELDEGIEDKAKDFLKVSKEQKLCKIECSRVNLEKSTVAGLQIWLDTMIRVRKMKIKTTLMGEMGVIDSLKKIVDESRKSQDASKQIYWLLLFELWQWQGREDEFENVALDFAMLYNVSPPGFDISGVVRVEEEKNEEFKKMAPLPPSIMTEGATNEWLDKLSKWMEDNKDMNAEIPFNGVERMTYDAAGAWSSWTHKDLVRVKRIRLVQPNHWILTLMNMVGLLSHIKAVNKK